MGPVAVSLELYLESVVGAILTDIVNLVHIFHGKVTNRISFILIFSNGKILTVRNAADGISLIWEANIPEQLKMDNLGETRLLDWNIFDPDEASVMIGKAFRSVEVARTEIGGLRMLRLKFEGGELRISNEDDELQVKVQSG